MTVYVRNDNPKNQEEDGLSWESAYSSLQTAINSSHEGDIVLVKAGNYRGDITIKDKNVELRSEAGAEETILQGSISFNQVEEATSLNGFTISDNSNSAIICDNASPIIKNNIIRNNRVGWYGSAIYCGNSSSPTITNNTIENNYISWYGTIYCKESSPIITNNIIRNNEAGWYGSAIYCDNSSPIISNNDILENNYGNGDDSIYIKNSPSITKIFNNIIIKSGGIIIEGNVNFLKFEYNFTDDRKWADTTNLIGDDPGFDPENPYHLNLNSICIDAGMSDETASNYDREGVLRPQDGNEDGEKKYDIGAYEVVPYIPGDINIDGQLTPSDALMVFQCYLGSGPCNDKCDVNKDGSFTPTDALCIFKKYLGQASCLD